MHEAEDSFDIILLVMVLAIFTPFMVSFAIPLFKGDVGGFGVQIEKTARETETEIVPEPREMTTDDILLMLLVADEYTPLPRKLNIDLVPGEQKEIAIDENFFLNRVAVIEDAFSAIPIQSSEDPPTPIQLNLTYGPIEPTDTSESGLSGMEYWNVTLASP